jgi:hypothetical protein
MGDWILPTKQIKTLSGYFGDDGVRGENLLETIGKTEVEPELVDFSQSFNDEKVIDNTRANIEKILSQVRGYDNDKDKDKDKESLPSLSFKEREYSFSKFKEESYEDMRCKEIAREIGDKDVAYCIGIYRKYGLNVLEKALVEFNDSTGWDKDNPPAFFNSLVQLEIASL